MSMRSELQAKNDRTLANPQKLMLDPYAKAVTHKPDLSSPEAPFNFSC